MKKIMCGALAVLLLAGVLQVSLLADEEVTEALSEPGGEYVEEAAKASEEEAEEMDALEEVKEDAEEAEEKEEVEETEAEEEAEAEDEEEISLPPAVAIPNDPEDVIIVDKRVYLDMEKAAR